MEALNAEQIAFYEANGYLLLESRVPLAIIEEIRAEIARFEAEAAGMTASNDRLDLEDTHSPEAPRVRRIKLPHAISEPVGRLMRSDHILAPARDLLGPDIRLHTTKLNMKSAGYGAAVEWHQDFAFYPHTNADVLAIGVLIDDLAPENGPLMVFPGSHKGPILDHFEEGVFVGAVDLAREGLDAKDAAVLTGPAGSISIHHGHALHGSALNRSSKDRRMLFYEMMAADSFPIMGSGTPFGSFEEFNARMLCGQPTDRPRLESVSARIPLPKPAKAGSIYEIQSGLKARAFERA